jgi:hypothetical protein
MKRNTALLVLAAAVILLAGCTGGRRAADVAPSPAQPYAGLQTRPIKALDPSRVDDLLAGRGAGYALAAELNRYPGPAHVLELADKLRLSDDQAQRTRLIQQQMQQEASRLGRRMVDLEQELDRLFAGGKAAEAELARLTREIALVEGEIRFTHLLAHLHVQALLLTEQIALYDQLRGYTGSAGHDPRKHGGH